MQQHQLFESEPHEHPGIHNYVDCHEAEVTPIRARSSPASHPRDHAEVKKPDLRSLAGRAVISVPEAGEFIGVGRSASYEAALRGQFPTRRVGRRLVVPVPAFLHWLGACPSCGDGSP